MAIKRIKDMSAMFQLGDDFLKTWEEIPKIIARQSDVRKKAIEAIAEVGLGEDTSEDLKELNLCVVTYWIHTLIFLRDFGISTSLLTAIASEKKKVDLIKGFTKKFEQDLHLQELSNFIVCIDHFTALEVAFYIRYMDGMQLGEFKQFQNLIASRGLEEPDIATFKEFVSGDIKEAIYNRLTEYYLDLMDEAKSYLAEKSFYPEKAKYLESSKEILVLLFRVCASMSDNPEELATEFLREKFDWKPEWGL